MILITFALFLYGGFAFISDIYNPRNWFVEARIWVVVLWSILAVFYLLSGPGPTQPSSLSLPGAEENVNKSSEVDPDANNNKP